MSNQELPVENVDPVRPNWDTWRQRGACMLWKAALLSMNIEPTAKSYRKLELLHTDLTAEYWRRLLILKTQYGLHEDLRRMSHALEREKLEQKFVRLDDVLIFAKNIGWSGLGPMELGLQRDCVVLPGGETVAFEDLAKGERDDLVRMGALLKILEEQICSDPKKGASKFLTGEKLNYSQIGAEIESIIAKAAKVNGNKAASSFKSDTNRKRLGLAAVALADCYKYREK